MPDRAELIRDLAGELRPVPHPRGAAALALTWWVGAWIFVVAATLWVAPMRPGFFGQLVASPRFAGETLLGLLAGALVIRVAFSLGIPGSGSAGRRVALALGALALWASAYLYGLADPALEPSALGARAACFVEVLLYGLPTLVVGLLLLRRLAPLTRSGVGFLIGSAAGAIPALLMQLACMYIPAHILGYHLAPALAVALLGALAGPLFLRRI